MMEASIGKRKRCHSGPYLDVGDSGAQRVLHPGHEVIGLLLRQSLRGCRHRVAASELEGREVTKYCNILCYSLNFGYLYLQYFLILVHIFVHNYI